VFQGQYLPLSLSKRGVPYIKKKKEKGKCKTKKELHKKEKKSEVWLSDFTKPVNLADFTKVETGPIWLVRFVRFYQACELIRFYQG
jgi:predicted DNA-binding helix-hairpin-helix protein